MNLLRKLAESTADALEPARLKSITSMINSTNPEIMAGVEEMKLKRQEAIDKIYEALEIAATERATQYDGKHAIVSGFKSKDGQVQDGCGIVFGSGLHPLYVRELIDLMKEHVFMKFDGLRVVYADGKFVVHGPRAGNIYEGDDFDMAADFIAEAVEKHEMPEGYEKVLEADGRTWDQVKDVMRSRWQDPMQRAKIRDALTGKNVADTVYTPGRTLLVADVSMVQASDKGYLVRCDSGKEFNVSADILVLRLPDDTYSATAEDGSEVHKPTFDEILAHFNFHAPSPSQRGNLGSAPAWRLMREVFTETNPSKQ